MFSGFYISTEHLFCKADNLIYSVNNLEIIDREVSFSKLKGQVLKSVFHLMNDRESVFREELDGICLVTDTKFYFMYHQQNCCESVELIDGFEDIKSICGAEVLQADYEENQSSDRENDRRNTWTFYKIATSKGYATLRWYGESNGHYSESVDFSEIKPIAIPTDIV